MITELIQNLNDWFFSLGDEYGVNPIIFGSIYVGAIPFFFFFFFFFFRHLRKGKPVIL